MYEGCTLGIDIGTHGSKGVIVTKDGVVLGDSCCTHNLIIPKAGYAEHNAFSWWNDFVFLTRDLLRKTGIDSGSISAVGCSAIAPTMLPLNNKGEPLRNAILYGIDNRAEKEISEMTERIGEDKLLEYNGILLSSQAVGPKILWFMKNEPELFKKTAKIVTATTYLVYRLTGRSVIDYYTASTFNPLFDCRKKEWTDALWPDAPLDLLPEITWTTDIVGEITGEAAKETGLEEGTKIIAGTSDAAAEAISSGVVESGDLMIMYGTSSFFIEITDKFAKADRNIWPTIFLQPEQYAIAAGMSTSGAIMSWFSDLLDGCSYRLLDRLAKEIPPGCEGLLLLPYFSGERTPVNDPNARGVLAGLSLFHKKGHIFRAILEAIAYGIRDNIENIEKAGLPVRKAVAIGGGTNSEVLLQIVSDVTKLDQLVPKITLGACYGDAFLAGLGIGYNKSLEDILNWVKWDKKITPIEKNSFLYDEYFKLYKEFYRATSKVSHNLVAISKR